MKSRFSLYGFWITLLSLTFWLGACDQAYSNPSASETTPPRYPSTLLTPESLTAQIPTIIPPTDSNCGYQWAYQNLPELTTQLQQTLQGLEPHVKVRAFAFGEDCVHADGSRNFLAMETDFEITLQVNNSLSDDEFGAYIVKGMEVILNIPKEQIKGPRPGRVSINFQTGNQNQGVGFYIDQYQALPAGLNNTKIYQKLKTSQ